MDKKIICKCPKCGNSVLEGKYNYECECGFKCGKNIWGVEISESLLKDICLGKTTETFTFQKPDKEWSAKLKYSEEEGKVVFDFSKPTFAKCPCCGGSVKEVEKYYLCENYKKTCNVIVSKNISGHSITSEEAKKLLNKETLKDLEFTWKSGKKGKADLKINDEGKTEFVFK